MGGGDRRRSGTAALAPWGAEGDGMNKIWVVVAAMVVVAVAVVAVVAVGVWAVVAVAVGAVVAETAVTAVAVAGAVAVGVGVTVVTVVTVVGSAKEETDAAVVGAVALAAIDVANATWEKAKGVARDAEEASACASRRSSAAQEYLLLAVEAERCLMEEAFGGTLSTKEKASEWNKIRIDQLAAKATSVKALCSVRIAELDWRCAQWNEKDTATAEAAAAAEVVAILSSTQSKGDSPS